MKYSFEFGNEERVETEHGSGKHVLVMALSTFPAPKEEKNGTEVLKVTRMRETDYFFEDASQRPALDENSNISENAGSDTVQREEHSTLQDGKAIASKINERDKTKYELRKICTGYYQLEPISWFVREELKDYVTDVILLETSETIRDIRNPVLPPPTASERADKINTSGDTDKISCKESGTGWTAAAYFCTWLKDFWGKELTIHEIEIDELNPAAALKPVMNQIRKLFNQTKDKENWRLWMDTHGGFRDISMVLVSAARFFATDKTDPIDTNGIFSVYHSQKPGVNDRIINQTAFYFTESAEALASFLEYGQYISLKFLPYTGAKKHAFISYRHDREFLTSVRNLFTLFKKNELLFWYDDGIQYHADWKKTLEEQNSGAETFIALLTNSYFKSKECWKELIRAVAARKEKEKGFDSIHFFMLEKNVDLSSLLPVNLENTEATREVTNLQSNLGVTDEDLKECLGIGIRNSNVQWFQWFGYMDKDEAVRPKFTSDLDGHIKETLEIIKKSMDQ